MSNPLKEDRLLLVVLVGGVLFVITAMCLVGVLLLRAPAAKPVVIAVNTPQVDAPPTTAQSESGSTSDEAETTVEAAPTATPTPTPKPTPTASPTDTPEPPLTATPISALATGDTLSLSTATPPPSPTPTHTHTPTPPSKPQEGLRVGNIAPGFTLGSNRASRVSLSDLRGKIVILNFWASWCPPCRHEVPALQSIHNEYGPQGVVVLAVNEGEKISNVERFVHDNGISFAVWLDEDGWAGNIYHVRSIPTTYFIDEEGIIRAIHIGTMTREQIVAYLEDLLR